MQKVMVRSNFHELQFSPEKPIYEYILEMNFSTPELIDEALKNYRQQLQQELILYMNINQHIYSPHLIQGDDIQKGKLLGLIDGQMENESTAQVFLKLVGRIKEGDLSRQQIISRLIKQVLRNQMSMVSVGRKGNKLFWDKRSQQCSYQNLEIWPGMECIFRSKNNQCTILLDCAFKILRYRTVFEELKYNMNMKLQHDFDLQGQIVMTIYNKKFYQILSVEFDKRPSDSFKNEKETYMTYEQYYKEKYNVQIPLDQPLLRASMRNNLGKNNKEIYLIPSLCQLTGLTDQIRNDFTAMKNIATVTKPSGEQRIAMAQTFIDQMCTTEIQNKTTGTAIKILSEWGLNINRNCLEMPAQTINPGNMLMGNCVQLNLADMNTNLDRQTQTQMYSTPQQQLILGIIMNEKSGSQVLDVFMENFLAACHEFKFFTFLPPKVLSINSDTDDELERVCDNLKNQALLNKVKVGFLIFLLPGQKKKAKLYKTAKKISMQSFGCPSQVIIEKTLQKNTRSIVNKILIQLNAKVGGIPWALDGFPQQFQAKPTMICGVDIFSKHGKKNQLAFCSTTDKYFSRYYSQVISSGEFSIHLQQALKASLQAFKQQNNVYPTQIIIYRDGVGEGQQPTVLGNELPQFQQAIVELGLRDQTKLTFVICNKRVSGKFYTGGQTRPENPLPGTYVDNPKVVDNEGKEFYLISQMSRSGTVTPTLYKIIHNDVQGNENDIKVLTFKLCWLYYNFTGPIKIPAPVRYAHCLCNFIGDHYDERDTTKFLPLPDLVNQKVLFYI
uniref:Aubergine/piwi homologue n=1 Tax=Paramecium caudatum TaxID=5885 RepID=Q9U5C9_PARCA|nr:PAP [Paramecium caudatum syngen 3]BAC23150.1 aubergine/piwi homologue [Paramecium caudatum]